MLRLRQIRNDIAALGILVAFLAAVLALLTTTADGAEIHKNKLAEGAESGGTATCQTHPSYQPRPMGIAHGAPRSAGDYLALDFAKDSRAAADGSAEIGVDRRTERTGTGGQTIACRSSSRAGPDHAGRGNCRDAAPADILNPTSEASLTARAGASGLRPADRWGAQQLLPAVGKTREYQGASPAAHGGWGPVVSDGITHRQAGVPGGAIAATCETSQTSGNHTPSTSRKSWTADAAGRNLALPGQGLQYGHAPPRLSAGAGQQVDAWRSG